MAQRSSTRRYSVTKHLEIPTSLSTLPSHRMQAGGGGGGGLETCLLRAASSPATQVPSPENGTFPPHLPWKCRDMGSVLLRLFGEHDGMLVASLAHNSHLLSDSLTSWSWLLFLKARRMSITPKQ